MYQGRETAGIYTDGYYPFKDVLGKGDISLLDFIRLCESGPMPDFDTKNLKPIEPDKLLSPIPAPFRDVICLGKNYADHAKEVVETKLETQDSDFIPKAPVYFNKRAYPAKGDMDEISLHSHLTSMVDYEVELAVIIGKTIYNIAPNQAEEAIFGYSILNDVTARDIQTKHGQWFFGKSLDGFCPIGPCIVSRDEIPFPVNLDVCCKVNGEIRQKSNTANLIFDIPYVISEISKGITLYPGDIIATGTPAGIGHAMKPPRYLAKGDMVECEIEKIGRLTNFFSSENQL
jgi:2-keto-4-pentenoate hydratase/2-oxohepta-3-ene-1,7-dioic acid hydratase in catechol pathway